MYVILRNVTDPAIARANAISVVTSCSCKVCFTSTSLSLTAAHRIIQDYLITPSIDYARRKGIN